MKRFLTPIFSFLLVYGLNVQAQTDTLRTKKDTIPGPIFYKEASSVEGAKATFTKETKELEMSSGSAKGTGKKAGDSAVSKTTTLSTPQNLLQAPTSSAGPTMGQLDVSPTGGATYTIPISLPPGLGSMVPQVALVYTSQGGNGVVGLGWSISGLSAITRIPTTNFHDNKITAVNFNTNDRFALDGQRLLLKSGAYGSDGAEYQTENYSNIKVVSRGVSPFGASHGPAYFEVFYPDGSKAVYGETNGSRTTTSFALTYMENPLGARINYTYAVSDHTFIVTEIAYGNIGASQTLNKINFHYSEINRAEMGYTGGDRLYRKSLLNKISITANGSAYRNYVLTLENIPTLNYKRVTVIREYNGDETLFRSPLYFTYTSSGDIITINSINSLSLTNIASNNSDVVAADFTGNGSMDFLLVPKNNKNKFWAFYDMESNSQYMQLGHEINTGAFKDIFPGTVLSSDDKVLMGQGIILVKENGPTSYKFTTYAATAYAPALFQYERTWDNPPLNPIFYSECDNQQKGGGVMDMSFLSGDFNGDGLTDLISVTESSVVIAEHPQDPSDPQYNPGNCDPEFGYVGAKVNLINLDQRLTSNFVLDLGTLIYSYNTNPYLHKLYTGDFNGDGKTDILHVEYGYMNVYGLNESNTAIELL